MKILRWLILQMPFLALVFTQFIILDVAHPLVFWQVGGCTLCVLLARDYLNWTERKRKEISKKPE